MITVEAVAIQSALQELGKAQGLELVFTYLDQHQPGMSIFSMKSMRNHPSEFGVQSLMLGWFSLRAFELQLGNHLPLCTTNTFEEYGRRNQELSDRVGQISREQFVEIMSLETSGQPWLMELLRNLVAAMLKPDKDAKHLIGCIQVYLTVKSIIDALDSVSN